MINQANFNSFKNFVFFTILTVTTLATLWMLKPFAYPLFLAVVLTILFRPLYLWLNKKFNSRKRLAATVTLIAIFLIILLPISALVPIVTQQTIDISTSVGNQVKQYVGDSESLTSQIKHLPIINEFNIDEQEIRTKFLEVTNIVSDLIFSNVKNLIKNTFGLTISLFIMFYTVFFFLVDGDKIINKFIRLSPLDDDYERKFISNFISTTKAVLKSSLLVGCIQGLVLGSSLFWFTGIPSPIFWGILMTVFAIIPVLGTGFIWAPVAVFQLLSGNFVAGIALLIGGAIIANVDNLLKPILIEKDIKIHPLIILLSTFGGLTMFGILGFIIGPIIASLVMELWNIYEFKYKKQLNNN